jgi:hypothetical protein
MHENVPNIGQAPRRFSARQPRVATPPTQLNHINGLQESAEKYVALRLGVPATTSRELAQNGAG